MAWAFPDHTTNQALLNCPAVDDQGHIFLCTQQKLVALVLQEQQPKVLWEYFLGSHVPGPVVLGSDGNIRLHCNEGYLHCITPDGKQAWTPVEVGEPLGWAAPIVDSSGGTLISAYDGGLIRVDPEGRIPTARFFRSRQKFDSAGIIHEGILYIGSETGYLFALGIDGRRAENLWDQAADSGFTGWFINSSPLVVRGSQIVVAARDEILYGFDLSGRRIWETKVPGLMMGSPVADRNGHLYVGISQTRRGREGRGMLVCVDGNSHRVRWQYDATDMVESTPVLGSDGIIYFGDNAGVIHALDAGGSAQWTAEIGPAIRSVGTLIAPQRLAFGADDETLVVLKCSSESLDAEGWPKAGRTLGQSGVV